MRLYNSLTRKIQNFEPLDHKMVYVYTCGPTVYNHAHIGNLRSYIFADTLHRALEQAGFKVRRAMNYTDVDDKTIRRSRDLYTGEPPMQALKQLTDKHIAIFLSDMRQLGNRVDNLAFLAATDYIEQMKALIIDLYQHGFAYIADDGVYFSIDAYKKSGKKYGQLLELTAANTSEARIQNDEYDKEAAHDFALWKVQKRGEPSWEFTLDGHNLIGRPGWHIECSAMSRAALGQPFDIHTGGVDNIFPHHENEIAQSTAGHDNPTMARFFVHGEHLLVDNARMGKSANNFYTVEDLTQKRYDPLAFRLKALQSHYRSQLNFTWESLGAAQNLLQSLRAWADLKHQKIARNPKAGEQYANVHKQILAAVESDLNTPLALTRLIELTGKAESDGIDTRRAQPLLNSIDRLFGLQLAERSDITRAQKEAIIEREQARKVKNWMRSDELRDRLAKQGIGLHDTARGAIWYRT